MLVISSAAWVSNMPCVANSGAYAPNAHLVHQHLMHRHIATVPLLASCALGHSFPFLALAQQGNQAAVISLQSMSRDERCMCGEACKLVKLAMAGSIVSRQALLSPTDRRSKLQGASANQGRPAP